MAYTCSIVESDKFTDLLQLYWLRSRNRYQKRNLIIDYRQKTRMSRNNDVDFITRT